MSMHWSVFVIVGAGVTAISYFADMLVFIPIGVLMLAYGLFKWLYMRLKTPKDYEAYKASKQQRRQEVHQLPNKPYQMPHAAQHASHANRASAQHTVQGSYPNVQHPLHHKQHAQALHQSIPHRNTNAYYQPVYQHTAKPSMFCPQCRRSIMLGGNFCPHCGAQVR